MPINYDSKYWLSIGTESDATVAKYRWEKTQVLKRQQISLLLLPHRPNNVNVTDANPIIAY